MKIKVTHTGRQVIAEFTNVSERVQLAVAENLHRGTLEVQRLQKELAPKASSLLTQAIQANQIDPHTWEIVAGTHYATATEEGSKAGGRAPVQAILDWIKQKQISPNDPEMDQEDLAFIMQRSIQAKGVTAQPYMQPALEQKSDRLRQLIHQAVTDGLHK
jgi:hypothetical protein